MSEQVSEEEKDLEEVVLSQLLRLNAVIHGTVFGLIFGLVIFIATIWLVVKGGPVVGPNLSLLGEFFLGYRVTVLGSFIGFAYGFVVGFAVGFAIATIYNWVADLRDRKSRVKISRL